jgi:peptidoglycan-associated lipoprotein
LTPGGTTQDIYTSEIIVGKSMKIDNIYFDLDKWKIRPDAAVELDKIVSLMKDNPDIIIELSSHTDCRGDAGYNLTLSDKRAKASAAYIVSKGVRRGRIAAKGYGESRLLNDCTCQKKSKADCSEEEHAKNRRTEFKVTGFLKNGGTISIESNL